MKKFILLLMLWVLTVPAFCSGIQIDALVAGLRDPLYDSFLSGGLVYTYTAGTTASKSVYMDTALTTPSTNPIVLDAYGRALRFANGKYKFIIKTSGGTLLWTLDNLEYSSVTTFASTTSNPFGASTSITNFRTAALTATLAADLNANGYAIHNVATPTLPYDLATLGYVDTKTDAVGSSVSALSSTVVELNSTIQDQLGSLSLPLPIWTADAAFAYTNYACAIGSAGWVPANGFSYNNLTAEEQWLWVNMQGSIALTVATTGLLISTNAYVGMTDADGLTYDFTRVARSDQFSPEHLASSPFTFTNETSWPFSLTGYVKVASGTSKTISLSYRGVDASSGYIQLSSNGRWLRWVRIK